MWDLRGLLRSPLKTAAPSFLWSINDIKSQELSVNLDRVIDTLKQPRSFQPQLEDWESVRQCVQATINETLKSLATGYEAAFGNVEERTEISPIVKTQLDFTSTASYCMAFSVVYFPLPSENGQSMLNVSMIMDTVQVDKPRSSPYTLLSVAKVGSPYEEHMCTAFHEPSGTLAFATSVKYFDKSNKADGVRFYVSKLYILDRVVFTSKTQEAWEEGEDVVVAVGMYITHLNLRCRTDRS
jgi:hypothetical protein